MATTNPHNDSNLNRVDLSLHEFLGAPWKNANNSQSNPVALEMLLMPNDDMLSPHDPRGEATVEEEPFIRRHGDKNKKPTLTQSDARALAMEQRKYGRAFKLTYPSLWYALRTGHAVTGAALQRVHHTISTSYKVVYLLSDFIWLVLTPIRRILGLLVGDEYAQAKRAFDSRMHRNRLWLGRSRGYTYVSAFYHRCRYIFSYFRVHQFYQVELFLRNYLTIRRGIQAILPVGLFCSVVYKAVLMPAIVDSRGLEKASQKRLTKQMSSLNQLFIADDAYPLDPLEEFTRLESGALYNHDTHYVIEFVEGQYTEVEKKLLRTIIHPGEFTKMLRRSDNVIGKLKKTPGAYLHPSANDGSHIGTYELNPEEEDQLPDTESLTPGAEEKDEETKLAEAAELRAAFVPDSPYCMLRSKDRNMLERYTTTEKVRKYRTHYEKRLAYKRKPSQRTYTEAIPYLQPERTELEKTKAAEKRQKFDAQLEALPLGHSVGTNVPWTTELYQAVEFGQKCLIDGKWEIWNKRLNEELSKYPNFNNRIVLSPFGLTTTEDVTNEKELKTLKPFSKKEEKFFPYTRSRDVLLSQAHTLSHVENILLNEDVRIAKAEWEEPAELAEAIMDWSFIDDEEDTEYDAADTDNEDNGEEDEMVEEAYSDLTENDLGQDAEEEVQNGEDAEDVDDEDGDDVDVDDDEDDGDEEYDDDDEDDEDNEEYDEDDDDDEDVENGEYEDEDDTEYDDEDDVDEDDDDKEYDDEDEEYDDEDEDDVDNEEDDDTENGAYEEDGTENREEVANNSEEVASTPNEYEKVWTNYSSLFINPVDYQPWQSMAWKSLALQLIMYGGIEFCIRLQCRGLRIRLKPLPNVHRLIPHLGRMPEGVHAREYVGETMNTVQVRKLLLAFQARRGTSLYGHLQWKKMWNRIVRQNISEKDEIWINVTTRKWQTKLSHFVNPDTEHVEENVLITRNVSQYAGLPKKWAMDVDIDPRYFGFDKLTETIQTHTNTKNHDGTVLPPPAIAERQQAFNRLGGEMALARGLEYGKAVQEEICHFPLFALIKPGPHRMNRLPKGMILLGDPGNGRTYFVRTLATEARLPLLITESNRYLDQALGLVRLKTLFKRARDHAPNILFIRDMDFMTRHRERYPMFTSVRATTQLLMGIDGYTNGTEPFPAPEDIFVIGSMTTTIMMDDACMRSGRFEWLLNFYYPPVDERHNMLVLHSTKSIVNRTTDVDWNYFTAMTDGFSCLDIRTLVNTSAMYAMKQNSTFHTGESVAFALGSINHIHDLPEVTFSSAGAINFFLRAEYIQRKENITQSAPFFTQTGHVPMYKKLMHFFHAMAASETGILAKRWGMPQNEQGFGIDLEPDRTLVNGLLPLFCEGLFLYNTQKMCGIPYPIITFDTYCSPLFFEMKHLVDSMSLDHTMERITKDHLFITTFDLWRRAHPSDWTPTALFNSKSIAMRTNATTMWRSTRFAKKYSVIGGLTELESEILWGPPPIATKIKNRVAFIGEKTIEFASRDATLFGTFETHSDLAFKCRKQTTARRVDQVSMEILDVMQKHWR